MFSGPATHTIEGLGFLTMSTSIRPFSGHVITSVFTTYEFSFRPTDNWSILNVSNSFRSCFGLEHPYKLLVVTFLPQELN